MFGTLRYSAQTDDTEFVERACDPSLGLLDGHGPRSSACDKCRSKKQKCSGQKDGCDRCKRTSSTCTYSSDGKKNRARRRKNVEKQTICDGARDSSQPTATSKRRPTTEEDSKDSSVSKQTSKQFTPQGRYAQQTYHLRRRADPFDPLDPSLETLEDDSTVAHQMLHEILPDYNRSNTDDYMDAITLSDQIDNSGYSYFSNKTEQGPAALALSVSTASPDFNMESYLASPPLTSSNPCFDTPSTGPATPWENFSQSTLPCIQDGLAGFPGSTTNSTNSSDESRPRCQCLQTIDLLLGKVDGKSQNLDFAALDTILSTQREALTHCTSVLKCLTCGGRPEYILLLGLVTERLATVYETIMHLYLDDVRLDRKHNPYTPSSLSRNISIGRYEISSPEEWTSLMRVLILLQLKTLGTLLAGMRTAIARAPSPAQLPLVQATEQRVQSLMQRLQRAGDD